MTVIVTVREDIGLSGQAQTEEMTFIVAVRKDRRQSDQARLAS